MKLYIWPLTFGMFSKYEIELDEQVEEDSHSQDLFLSDDELSEESQPQSRQSDPEYNVSSSELSQSTQESQVSTDTHKKRLF